jgi:hypothetical protein
MSRNENINSDFQFGNQFGKDEIREKIKLDIKQPSKAVIEISKRFKNESENYENSCENETIFPNHRIDENLLYDKFKIFILNNSEGDKLPKNSDIEKELNISEGKRKELFKKARENGLIERKNDTRSVLCLDYEM